MSAADEALMASTSGSMLPSADSTVDTTCSTRAAVLGVEVPPVLAATTGRTSATITAGISWPVQPHLHIIQEPCVEQRPQRPVDRPGSQQISVAGAGFSPVRAAGDAARSVQALTEVHLRAMHTGHAR